MASGCLPLPVVVVDDVPDPVALLHAALAWWVDGDSGFSAGQNRKPTAGTSALRTINPSCGRARAAAARRSGPLARRPVWTGKPRLRLINAA